MRPGDWGHGLRFKLKTLREISEQEQLEALAGDPWADLGDRCVAMEHLKAIREHDRWIARWERNARIVNALTLLALIAAIALLIRWEK